MEDQLLPEEVILIKILYIREQKVMLESFSRTLCCGNKGTQTICEALSKYELKHLWLDRDATGMAYTEYALSLKEGYVDESALYQEYKDLNDYLRLKYHSTKLRIVP